jgi:DNA-binding PadR family transcriptional regulator
VTEAAGNVKRRTVANPLGLAVLALLREKPMHPYQMASTLRERAKEESIKLNYGSLYTVVGALERGGLVLARETVREGARPERTVYALTEEGERELVDWMSELLSVPAKEYPRFEAALSLMPVLPPDDVARLLENRVQRLDVEVAKLTCTMDLARKQGLERLFIIESEYEIVMREAERTWVAALVKLIRASAEFTRTWKSFHANSRRSGPKAAMVAAPGRRGGSRDRRRKGVK